MVSLIVDVVTYLVFIESHRGYEVAALPERALGKLLGFLLDPR